MQHNSDACMIMWYTTAHFIVLVVLSVIAVLANIVTIFCVLFATRKFYRNIGFLIAYYAAIEIALSIVIVLLQPR